MCELCGAEHSGRDCEGFPIDSQGDRIVAPVFISWCNCEKCGKKWLGPKQNLCVRCSDGEYHQLKLGKPNKSKFKSDLSEVIAILDEKSRSNEGCNSKLLWNRDFFRVRKILFELYDRI